MPFVASIRSVFSPARKIFVCHAGSDKTETSSELSTIQRVNSKPAGSKWNTCFQKTKKKTKLIVKMGNLTDSKYGKSKYHAIVTENGDKGGIALDTSKLRNILNLQVFRFWFSATRCLNLVAVEWVIHWLINWLMTQWGFCLANIVEEGQNDMAICFNLLPLLYARKCKFVLFQKKKVHSWRTPKRLIFSEDFIIAGIISLPLQSGWRNVKLCCYGRCGKSGGYHFVRPVLCNVSISRPGNRAT